MVLEIWGPSLMPGAYLLRTNVTKEGSWKMHQCLLHCTFFEDAFRFVRVKCHASGVLYESKVLN